MNLILLLHHSHLASSGINYGLVLKLAGYCIVGYIVYLPIYRLFKEFKSYHVIILLLLLASYLGIASTPAYNKWVANQEQQQTQNMDAAIIADRGNYDLNNMASVKRFLTSKTFHDESGKQSLNFYDDGRFDGNNGTGETISGHWEFLDSGTGIFNTIHCSDNKGSSLMTIEYGKRIIVQNPHLVLK